MQKRSENTFEMPSIKPIRLRLPPKAIGNQQTRIRADLFQHLKGSFEIA